jgi:hypothetical protein
MMHNFQAVWEFLLAACGGIAIISGAIKLIVGMFNPYKALRIRVETHDKALPDHEARIRREEEGTKTTMQALLAIIDNKITGNSIDKLKQARDMINAYLINK